VLLAVARVDAEERAARFMNAYERMQEIESGNSSVPRWNLFSPDSVRVVSWNIDRGSKLRGVIEFLAGEKADIVLLQEADLNARRTHHINVAREIAQKLAMNYVFGREFQELTQGSKTSPAFHGQATLSRWPLSNCRIIRLHMQPSDQSAIASRSQYLVDCMAREEKRT
jgi:endonuclease/exonuclease/phosphatase family metal-dependent hydrolase